MARIFFGVAAAMLLLSACSRGPVEHRVLFIGNSFTHGNDMPEMVRDIAGANGVNIDVEMVAPGGAFLDEHVVNLEVADKIRSGDFDTVVFQEQSVITSVPSMTAQRTMPAAIALDRMADESGVRVVWFQTWGHLNGFPDVGHTGYSTMQDQIIASYDQIAEQTGGVVAPVGETWRHTQGSGTGINLYAADAYHPSAAGSYLAALELADAIIAPIIVESPSSNGVDGDTAAALLASVQSAPN